jgi:hypothetical protein
MTEGLEKMMRPTVLAILALGLMLAAPLQQSNGEAPLHPELSAGARLIIDAIDTEQQCELSEAVTVEIEGLLLRPYNVLTVQTEAERLIQVYAQCANPPRAAALLAERVDDTSDASCRAFFLRGLAVTKHPIAIQTLVDRLDDEETYVTLESPGHSEDLSIGSSAAHLLGKLFPEVETGALVSWVDWWERNRDAYWRKWGETPPGQE